MIRTFHKRVKTDLAALTVLSELLRVGNTSRIEVDDDRAAGRGILIIVHAPSITDPKQWRETT